MPISLERIDLRIFPEYHEVRVLSLKNPFNTQRQGLPRDKTNCLRS